MNLLPVQADHYPFLYEMAIARETGFRWRYQGHIPPYEQFVQQVWARVLLQFLVTRSANSEALGLVVCYDHDLRNGHASIASVIEHPDRFPSLGIEAMGLFVNYIFATWDFRKLYAEVPGFNVPQFASGFGRRFREEGVFREHQYFDGQYWDTHIVALYRDEWRANQTRSRTAIRRMLD